MGAAAAPKIWNGMAEAKAEAGDNKSSSADIRYSSLSVDSSLSLAEMTPRVIELCKDLFTEWSNLDDSCFSVETVSGGITNLLLKASVKKTDGKEVQVTVRLYGPNTDYVINRERELQAIKYLSAAGFGAKLLGVFPNGMVQSFINARTLVPEGEDQDFVNFRYETSSGQILIKPDMSKPNLAAEIAKQLRTFHQVDIPGSKEPQLWNELFKFYENASNLKFDDVKKQTTYETISFKEVYNEIIELKELTGLLNAPVVFAHNDLLSGNLMLNEDEGKLYIIDFEYGSYNYRGYDIGNHFAEYAGYDCDYSLCPSKDQQYHFIRHYLQPDNPDKVPDKDIEALYVESNTYMLASHVFWALWALIQAKMSPIDFDYIGYFFLRYNEYKRQKDNCCSLARSYLSGGRSG
ncbi:hypothetical protein Tsubulata_023440 [Turnera subulata]|uniref:ethanolamine kinase n=1 Tax=Turnera subulata TaxID=218843 RepID=A0A9Q0G9E4_9ROSI|nr:hypothetical protein Tsubulata_023440 [Turnera subulata]